MRSKRNSIVGLDGVLTASSVFPTMYNVLTTYVVDRSIQSIFGLLLHCSGAFWLVEHFTKALCQQYGKLLNGFEQQLFYEYNFLAIGG